jgi:hypothetical protein
MTTPLPPTPPVEPAPEPAFEPAPEPEPALGAEPEPALAAEPEPAPKAEPAPPPTAARRRGGRSDSLVWGALLVVVGVFLLLRNFEIITTRLHNWWALFILIPAVGSLVDALARLQRAGRWTVQVSAALLGAVVISLLALTFLLGWDLGRLWPLFLIAGGVAALLSARGSRPAPPEE